jgi:hypothetical protein
MEEHKAYEKIGCTRELSSGSSEDDHPGWIGFYVKIAKSLRGSIHHE